MREKKRGARRQGLPTVSWSRRGKKGKSLLSGATELNSLTCLVSLGLFHWIFHHLIATRMIQYPKKCFLFVHPLYCSRPREQARLGASHDSKHSWLIKTLDATPPH